MHIGARHYMEYTCYETREDYATRILSKRTHVELLKLSLLCCILCIAGFRLCSRVRVEIKRIISATNWSLLAHASAHTPICLTPYTYRKQNK